jgi:hypothetical protein
LARADLAWVCGKARADAVTALLEFFRFNVDGTFAGTQKVTRTGELSEGRTS